MLRSTLIALGIVTAVAVVGAGAAVWSQSAAYSAGGASTQPLFPALAQANADVDGLSVETPDYALTLARHDKTWVASSLADYPVRADTAARLVAAIAAMHPVESKTSTPDWYHYIGVEDRTANGSHSVLVKLSNGGKDLATVLVGKVSASLGSDPIGGTFVRVPGEAQAWLGSGMVEIPGYRADWFDNLFNLSGPDVRRISISDDGKPTFVASRASGDTPYQLEVGAAPGTRFNDTLLRNIQDAMVSVAFDDIRKAADVPLPASGGRVVTFETAEGLVLTAQLAQADNKPWVLFHADLKAGGTADAAAINASTLGWAFRLSNGKMLALLSKVSDLLTAPAPTPAPEQTPDVPFPANGLAPGQVITDPNILKQLQQQGQQPTN